MIRLYRAILLTLLLSGLLLVQSTNNAVAQDEEDYLNEARSLLAQMTPEERVGQLFLVTFIGDTVTNDSDIADLIFNYNVGGVSILSRNDNIGGSNNAPVQLAELINDLQFLSLNGPLLEEEGNEEEESDVQISPSPSPALESTRIPVPLYIATVHEGDGPPHTQILHGLTELPNPMAIGATWEPEQGKAIGEIAGKELSALGINLLLGPSLDVLESPQPFSPSNQGTRSFGGDPFWVGVMGQSYTAGIHEGSEGRIAVIAKHFPGYGSSDRPINEEVGTVRKSLEQLKQIELAPFFSVTGNAIDPLSTVDGLLTAHVRYQGFQGNIRATTAPVSFDPQALTTLLQLPQFTDWRQNGGLIVSDELGVRAVQRFYDGTGQEFPHRQVAKDALLAGNDLLYLSQFALAGRNYNTQLANMKDTIIWFQEKYETDQTFQERIDDASLTIIQQKLKLYDGNFEPENVFVDPLAIPDVINQGQSSVFDLAQDAITLIVPSQADLDDQLPIAVNERIVIFTDLRESSQCSTCDAEPWLDVRALEMRMLALYGPQASAQVRPDQISSFSFKHLNDYLLIRPEAFPSPTPSTELTPSAGSFLGTPTPEDFQTVEPTPTTSPSIFVQGALENANWIIFAMLRPEASVPDSDALNIFLSERPDIVRNANIVVLAFNAPYFLDTTEISSLTTYYGLYSKIDPFVDAAVRALFQESPLSGRSPVNIEGIRYDLFEVTKPDPEQVIELFIVDGGVPTSPPSQAPLEVLPGATLRLQTGVIVDRNGKPVPDGTPVQFIQQDRIQGFVNVIGEQPTLNGIANLDYLLEARAGNFRITATAGEVRASQEVDIVIGENAVVSISTPTPAPTHTPTTTLTPSPTSTTIPSPQPTSTLTPRPTATIEPESDIPDEGGTIIFGEVQMLLGFGLGLLATGGAGYAISRTEHRKLTVIVRCMLWGLLGALIAYNYFMLSLPGTTWLKSLGGWAALLITLFGGVVGLLLYRLSNRP